MFPGLGDLVFFDTGEQDASQTAKILAQIPKLAPEWKIIYDFKLTAQPRAYAVELKVCSGDNYFQLYIALAASEFQLNYFMYHDEDDDFRHEFFQSRQQPKIEEWTRVEIVFEKVDDKYFLAFSVDGAELGRAEVKDPDLRSLTDLTISTGVEGIPGFIRKLIVLEKNQASY